MVNEYDWVPFYEAFADKLLTYSDRRDELFNLLKTAASEQPLMKYLQLGREDKWGARDHQIDPFTVMGIFNRSLTSANRIKIVKTFADMFGMHMAVPTTFDGIPVLNNMNSFFNGSDKVWDLFVLAMKAADTNDYSTEFKQAFEKSITVNGNGLASITMGLYWIRPRVFMPLDKNSRAFITSNYGLTIPDKRSAGEGYVSFLQALKSKVAEKTPGLTLPEISHAAWSQNQNPPQGIESNENQQRTAFIDWYKTNGGSSSTAQTISTALNRTKLKNGRPIFSITTYDELNNAIADADLDAYFQTSDGDYTKMDIIFNMKSNVQNDDLKSGIKYYLSFLKSVTEPPAEPDDENSIPKNLILFGTPGTGKTYSTVQYAVAIIEKRPIEEIKAQDYDEVLRRYKKHKEAGLIAFTTFHQSFGYEEFIEGIRPLVTSEDRADSSKEIEYEVHDGIFKSFCNNAGTPDGSDERDDLKIGKSPSVWKVSLESTGDNPTRTECLKNDHIRIGYDQYGKTLPDTYEKGDSGRNILNAFYYKMQIGDIVLSCYSNKTIDAIGVITGEPEWHDEYHQYKRLRKVKWLVSNIRQDIYELNSEKLMMQPSVYKMSISVSDILQLLRELKPTQFSANLNIPNRVFIIDEINRGNISKIFGELITLIEPTRRIGAREETRASLPYSEQKFGVPDNVYLIGTMNTADRSIARLDAALRRRFSHIEMLPEPETLKGISVDGINIATMLDTLNKRITILLDREHTIGHSFFLQPLKEDPSIECLANIFQYEIIPLLQEYFYDDYEKIQLVLGDNQKPDDSTRFIVKKTDAMTFFGNDAVGFAEYYVINPAAFKDIDAYAFF